MRRTMSKSDPNYPGMEPIFRLNRPWHFTEKVEGTNGLIAISNNMAEAERSGSPLPLAIIEPTDIGRIGIWAGSKNRWLAIGQDNFGLAGWVLENHANLVTALGPGLHRGEWWGSGIQRGYGLPKGEK